MEAIPNGPPTLVDVAREAGCGMATASRAISGKGSVSAAARQRVREAVTRLGYRPEPGLATLANRRWGQGGGQTAMGMALIHAQFTCKQASRISMNSYRRTLERARERSRQLGYDLQEFSLKGIHSQDHLARMMENRGVKGLLLTAPLLDLPYTFDTRPFAIVMIGEELPDIAFHRVGSDWSQVIDLAAGRAYAAGCRRIGFVIQQFANLGTQRRILAPVLLNLREIEALAGPQPCPLVLDLNKQGDLVDWYRIQRPDVIISTTDMALFRMRDNGIRVPEDVRFITLNLTAASACVDRQAELIGAHAVDLLHQQLGHRQFGLPAFPMHVVVEGNWIDGDTLPHITDWPIRS